MHHVVTRPGRVDGDPDVTIQVANELATVPGIPQDQLSVDFYSRNYPEETQSVDKAADREWTWTVYTGEMYEYRKQHDKDNKPLVDAAFTSGDVLPTGTAVPGKDVTDEIRNKAGSWVSVRSDSLNTIADIPIRVRRVGLSTSMLYVWP